MKHRGVDVDVEEKPPSWWHWKIYPRAEGDQPVIGNMKFQTREAAVDACIVEIKLGLDKGERGGLRITHRCRPERPAHGRCGRGYGEGGHGDLGHGRGWRGLRRSRRR
jgi:hypothetical protein